MRQVMIFIKCYAKRYACNTELRHHPRGTLQEKTTARSSGPRAVVGLSVQRSSLFLLPADGSPSANSP
jgi:hypothetical protein